MNIWENTVITTKGIALLAKLVEGNTLTITKAMSGAGFVSPGMLQNQILLTDPAQELIFRNVSYPEEGKCTVTCYLSNDELEAGYTAKQIGVFAMDPDEGEILFFISQAATGTGVEIPSMAESPGYSAEWAFTFAYGQADTVDITVDPSNTVTKPQMEEYVSQTVDQSIEDMPAETVKAKLDEAEIITTTGTGAAYMATVPGITALKAGVSFIMVPHVVSTTNQPTLNVNGLGAKNLRQPLTSNTGATTTAATNTWLTAGKPIRVSYDGTLWKIDIPRPSATYLYGTVPVASGGTGADNAADALANLGAASKEYVDDAVNSIGIADGSVTSAKIGSGAVTSAKIASSAVTNAKIANSAVTEAKIADGAVTNAKITDGAINGAKIADGSVSSSEIADGAVVADKIGSGAVTSAKIGSGAVTSAKINDKAVTTAKIADGAVTAAKVGSDVATTAYVDGKRLSGTVTLAASGWSSGVQTVSVSGILATDMPHWGVVYSSTASTREAEKEAFDLVDVLETSAGKFTFRCFEDVPNVALTIQWEVNR